VAASSIKMSATRMSIPESNDRLCLAMIHSAPRPNPLANLPSCGQAGVC
jgi:hypothetical protein